MVRKEHNTPGVIKYPFWRMTAKNPNAVYACVNYGEAFAPAEISDQAICIDVDIEEALETCSLPEKTAAVTDADTYQHP